MIKMAIIFFFRKYNIHQQKKTITIDKGVMAFSCFLPQPFLLVLELTFLCTGLLSNKGHCTLTFLAEQRFIHIYLNQLIIFKNINFPQQSMYMVTYRLAQMICLQKPWQTHRKKNKTLRSIFWIFCRFKRQNSWKCRQSRDNS